MKVLHVITGLGSGGAENALLRLITKTSSSITHVIVCLGGEDQLSSKFLSTGFPIYHLNMKSGQPSIAAVRKLITICKQEKPQAVQTWMYHSDLIGGLVAMIQKIPVVWSIRQDSPTVALNGLSTWLIAKCCALLSSLIPESITCNSNKAILNHVDFGYAENKFVCIPNGFEDNSGENINTVQDTIRHQSGIRKGDCIIGHVARFHPVKNHQGFLKAFEILQRQYPQVKAVMIGQNITNSNHSLLSGVSESVKGKLVLLGARSDVTSLYGLFDFFVMNSYSEAFPNVVAEAMLNGIPCIVTNVGDAAEIVGDTGWIIPVGDTALLSQALHEALQLSSEEKMKKGKEARQRILKEYSIQNMVTQFEAVWNNIIK